MGFNWKILFVDLAILFAIGFGIGFLIFRNKKIGGVKGGIGIGVLLAIIGSVLNVFPPFKQYHKFVGDIFQPNLNNPSSPRPPSNI